MNSNLKKYGLGILTAIPLIFNPINSNADFIENDRNNIKFEQMSQKSTTILKNETLELRIRPTEKTLTQVQNPSNQKYNYENYPNNSHNLIENNNYNYNLDSSFLEQENSSVFGNLDSTTDLGTLELITPISKTEFIINDNISGKKELITDFSQLKIPFRYNFIDEKTNLTNKKSNVFSGFEESINLGYFMETGNNSQRTIKGGNLHHNDFYAFYALQEEIGKKTEIKRISLDRILSLPINLNYTKKNEKDLISDTNYSSQTFGFSGNIKDLIFNLRTNQTSRVYLIGYGLGQTTSNNSFKTKDLDYLKTGILLDPELILDYQGIFLRKTENKNCEPITDLLSNFNFEIPILGNSNFSANMYNIEKTKAFELRFTKPLTNNLSIESYYLSPKNELPDNYNLQIGLNLEF